VTSLNERERHQSAHEASSQNDSVWLGHKPSSLVQCVQQGLGKTQ